MAPPPTKPLQNPAQWVSCKSRAERVYTNGVLLQRSKYCKYCASAFSSKSHAKPKFPGCFVEFDPTGEIPPRCANVSWQRRMTEWEVVPTMDDVERDEELVKSVRARRVVTETRSEAEVAKALAEQQAEGVEGSSKAGRKRKRKSGIKAGAGGVFPDSEEVAEDDGGSTTGSGASTPAPERQPVKRRRGGKKAMPERRRQTIGVTLPAEAREGESGEVRSGIAVADLIEKRRQTLDVNPVSTTPASTTPQTAQANEAVPNPTLNRPKSPTENTPTVASPVRTSPRFTGRTASEIVQKALNTDQAVDGNLKPVIPAEIVSFLEDFDESDDEEDIPVAPSFTAVNSAKAVAMGTSTDKRTENPTKKVCAKDISSTSVPTTVEKQPPTPAPTPSIRPPSPSPQPAHHPSLQSNPPTDPLVAAAINTYASSFPTPQPPQISQSDLDARLLKLLADPFLNNLITTGNIQPIEAFAATKLENEALKKALSEATRYIDLVQKTSEGEMEKLRAKIKKLEDEKGKKKGGRGGADKSEEGKAAIEENKTLREQLRNIQFSLRRSEDERMVLEGQIAAMAHNASEPSPTSSEVALLRKELLEVEQRLRESEDERAGLKSELARAKQTVTVPDSSTVAENTHLKTSLQQSQDRITQLESQRKELSDEVNNLRDDVKRLRNAWGKLEIGPTERAKWRRMMIEAVLDWDEKIWEGSNIV